MCLPLFVAITSCEEPKKGCTDIRATNFDVTAAKEDNINCVFPKLTLQVAYTVGDSSLLFSSTYKNALNQSFKIVNASTYISDCQLFTSDNKIFKTTDSMALYRLTDTIRVLNSFAMIGRNNGFQFTIGTFEAVGKTFTKLRFNIGLIPDVNKTDATKMPSGHPLSIRPDSMYNRATKSYVFNKLVVASGTNFKDTSTIEVSNLTPIELTKNLPTIEGQDVVINLIVNYLPLFKDIDFTKSKDLIQQKFVANINDATIKIFSIK
jgi:hypothetical protein